jgi:hypothetical protein
VDVDGDSRQSSVVVSMTPGLHHNNHQLDSNYADAHQLRTPPRQVNRLLMRGVYFPNQRNAMSEARVSIILSDALASFPKNLSFFFPALKFAVFFLYCSYIRGVLTKVDTRHIIATTISTALGNIYTTAR